jgi:hypothetical protein
MTTIISGDSGITFPNSTVQASAGSVLQVVNASYTTATTTTSTSFVTTGLTASITPKFSTSKIVVFCNVRSYVSVAANNQSFALYRNSTNLTSGIGYSVYASGGVVGIMQSFNWSDSPATTSSTTYTLYMSAPNATTVGIQADGNQDYPATITLMEIAG